MIKPGSANPSAEYTDGRDSTPNFCRSKPPLDFFCCWSEANERILNELQLFCFWNLMACAEAEQSISAKQIWSVFCSQIESKGSPVLCEWQHAGGELLNLLRLCSDSVKKFLLHKSHPICDPVFLPSDLGLLLVIFHLVKARWIGVDPVHNAEGRHTCGAAPACMEMVCTLTDCYWHAPTNKLLTIPYCVDLSALGFQPWQTFVKVNKKQGKQWGARANELNKDPDSGSDGPDKINKPHFWVEKCHKCCNGKF